MAQNSNNGKSFSISIDSNTDDKYIAEQIQKLNNSNNQIRNQINELDLNGILLIDKPAGITTYDIIRKIKHKYYNSIKEGRFSNDSKKLKIGHGGTLDPFASGLVIILMGKATKLFEQTLKHSKTYRVEMVLGLQTDTLDIDGKVTDYDADLQSERIIEILNSKSGVNASSQINSQEKIFAKEILCSKDLSRLENDKCPNEKGIQEKIDTILKDHIEKKIPDIDTRIIDISKKYVGEIIQTPPQYSAKKVNGVRAYDLARKNIQVDLKPSKVQIHSIDKVARNGAYISLEVTCGSGTYIRSLVRDIGNDLGCYATCTALRRVRIWQFEIRNALKYDKIDIDNILDYLISVQSYSQA